MSIPDLPFILMTFVHLLLSLSFHESAHAWMANRLGDPTARFQGRITLNPLPHIDPIGTILLPLISLFSGGIIFGWAKPTPVDSRYFHNPKRDQMLTALAGPLSNLILATVFAVLFHLTLQLNNSPFKPNAALQALFVIFRSGVILNVVLAVFNLLPIFPLDGSWVAEGLMPLKHLHYWYQFKQYSMFILILFFLVPGLYRITLYPVISFLVTLYRIPF